MVARMVTQKPEFHPYSLTQAVGSKQKFSLLLCSLIRLSVIY